MQPDIGQTLLVIFSWAILIFTKKGPIEIAFKQVHYTSLLITTIVGLTSIVYWSAKGIYSAIDVAKKNFSFLYLRKYI